MAKIEKHSYQWWGIYRKTMEDSGYTQKDLEDKQTKKLFEQQLEYNISVIEDDLDDEYYNMGDIMHDIP